MVEKSEVLEFVRQMKATDHVILFYENIQDKHLVLFNYLKAGLEQGEAGAYITSQETVGQIRDSMKRFGLDVERFERSGALHIIDYKEWYLKDDKFTVSKTFEAWKRMYDQAIAAGYEGLRVTGEMACFFERRMVNELLEYEKALHRTLELPMSAICAYDSNAVAHEGDGRLFLELIKAHSTVLFMGPQAGAIRSY